MHNKKQKSVAFRDHYGTYHNKLKKLCEDYKKRNPDNLEPDELNKVKISWFLRRLIDNEFQQVFKPDNQDYLFTACGDGSVLKDIDGELKSYVFKAGDKVESRNDNIFINGKLQR